MINIPTYMRPSTLCGWQPGHHNLGSRHPQAQAGYHSQAAASLHHEFDEFYLKEAERVKHLREKWTNCTMEEWQEAGEGE